jgi:hypothetical protein
VVLFPTPRKTPEMVKEEALQFEATHLPATDTTIIFFSTGLELMSFQLSYLLKRKKGQD